MSRWIRLSDRRGRDARVRLHSRGAQPAIKYQTQDGQKAKPYQVIKSPIQKSYANLRRKVPDNKELVKLLIESDPEIDLEAAGRKAGPTDRILLDQDGRVLYSASMIEIVYDTNGHAITQREPKQTNDNINF